MSSPRRLEVLVRPDGLDVLEVDGGPPAVAAAAIASARVAAPTGVAGSAGVALAGAAASPPVTGAPAARDPLSEALAALGVRCRLRFRSPCG